METRSRNLKDTSLHINQNNTNTNNMFLISKLINDNDKINNYQNPIMRHRSPMNIGVKYQINNVHINQGKILTENNQLNNLSNILNDQNIDTLNIDLFPKNTNQLPKIIIQKKMNKEQNKQKFINVNTIGNNILKNRINDIQEQKENKEKKGNYKYIIKNVKKINHPIKSEKKEINDLNNNKIKNSKNQNQEEESTININQIREELISIHDNRKYNYDKKVQKINPGKIPIPQGTKLVERILGINDKKEIKEENKKIMEFKTTSKFNVESFPEYKIPKELLHKQQMINNGNDSNNISPINLRQNIKLIKASKNNNNQAQNKIIHQPPKIIPNITQINNNNISKNITNPQNINYNTPQKQNNDINNNPSVNTINQAINSLQEKNKHINQPHGILIPPPTNNLNNDPVLLYQQLINNNQQKTVTIVQKLSQKKISNKNMLIPNPNMINLNSNNNNIIPVKPEQQNNDEYFDNDSDEPKNTDEMNNESITNTNNDIPQNISIAVKKITPLLPEQILNINQLKGPNENLVQNKQIIHQNLNVNSGLIQNVRKIQPQNKNEPQQQRVIINQQLQQNINMPENNIIQNNIQPIRNNMNFPQNMNNNNILNHNIINQNIPPILNNQNPQNINNQKQMLINNNQNTKIPHPQNFAMVQKIQPQQIPNNTIIGNTIIKDGKVYYINPPQNQIINPKIINNNFPQPKPNLQMHQNNQMPNQASQNLIYRQIINNQIIYRDQNGKIINIQKSPQHVNNQTKFKNCQNVIKKKKLSRVAKLLQAKDTNDRKPALQYKIERNRPLYVVPPSKKRAISQGKPFTLINKYYDENYILEEDEEGEEKNEDINNIHIEKNMNNNENSSN